MPVRIGRADIEFTEPEGGPGNLLRGERAGLLFNIDASTYDLWRGNTVAESPEDYYFRWNVSRRMPQPRTPGSRYRLACEVAVLKDQWEEAGVYPWTAYAIGQLNGWFKEAYGGGLLRLEVSRRFG